MSSEYTILTAPYTKTKSCRI